MIRRALAGLLALLLTPALSFAQVVGQGANAAPGVVGSVGASVGAPALSPLSAPTALTPSASLAPSLAVPALTPSPALIAPISPAASKAAAEPLGEGVPLPLPLAVGKGPKLPAPSIERPRTEAEIAALKLAWQSARALVEDVPDAPSTLAEAPLSATPKREYTPSPEDWRDDILHFILLDRFARAGKVRTHGDQTSGTSRHGGNLRGVISQLDYLKGSGVTTLLLSPVTQNKPESYHGYAAVHLLAIDPHLGTMDDFKELVNEAHKRGLKVVLDWGINHAGPVFEYKEGSQWRGLEGQPKEIGEWTERLLPSDLQDPKHFTRRGVIDDWNDREQSTHGDFPPNYRHFASGNKETGDALIHIAKWFIQETDIDGLRVDAVRHVAPGFVPRFASEIKAYAASIGKKNFFLVGEDSTGIDAELVPQLTTNKMDSVFAYPAYRRETYALHGKAPSRALEDSFLRTAQALGPLADRLLRFIDNHDVYRFLRLGEPEAQLKVALAYLLFSIGIPMTYAGTEQGFRQDTDRFDPENPQFPADPGNRADQFDKHDASNPVYQWLANIAGVRKEFEALRRGEQWTRWSDSGQGGLFVFSRIAGSQEIVVALNFGGEARTEEMWIDAERSRPDTVLRDALDPSYRVTVYDLQGGSRVNLSIPPRSVRVMVRDR